VFLIDKTSSICFPFTHSVAAKRQESYKSETPSVMGGTKHEISFNTVRTKTFEKKKNENSNAKNCTNPNSKDKLETKTKIY